METETIRTVWETPKWPVSSGAFAELGEKEKEQAWCGRKNLGQKVGVLGLLLLQ